MSVQVNGDQVLFNDVPFSLLCITRAHLHFVKSLNKKIYLIDLKYN